MITRVWGIVNSTSVEFTPVQNKPDYWEGYAPISKDDYQDIEIWAENDKGARGHLQCSIQVTWHSPTVAKLMIFPYYAKIVDFYKVELIRESGVI